MARQSRGMTEPFREGEGPSRRLVPRGTPRFVTPQKAEVDIHQMTQEQAKRHLERLLSRLDGNVRELTVIHGYSGGTVLRDMVRSRLKHPRIRSKMAGMNPGITVLFLQ